MKKHLILLACIMLLAVPASRAAFHFSQVAPSGQTLYFNITDSAARTVEVTCPGESAANAYRGFVKPAGSLVIPSTVTYNDTAYTVTALGCYALYECDSLTSIEFPATVTSLDTAALIYCYRLSGMEVPSTITSIAPSALGLIRNITYHGTADCSSCGALGVNAFYEAPFTFADSTRTVLLGFDVYAPGTPIPASVTTIGTNAFFCCKEVDSISLPGTVTEYGERIFFNSKLKKITFPEGLTAVPEGICISCRDLIEVSLPSTITRIEEGAFMDCEALPGIVIPDAVTYIAPFSFAICFGLQNVTLGRGLDSIAENAFNMCMALTEITSRNPVAPALGNEVFLMVPPTAVVNIPCGSTESYDSIWGGAFTDFVEVAPVLTVLSDNEAYGQVEVLVEHSCANPLATIQATAAEGYAFIRWSDGSTENPYSFDVDRDTVLTAYFAPLEGISDTDRAQWSATVNGTAITLSGIADSPVRIFDTLGRLLYSETPAAATVTVRTPNAGVYMVQVGHSPARRIVTMN